MARIVGRVVNGRGMREARRVDEPEAEYEGERRRDDRLRALTGGNDVWRRRAGLSLTVQ